MVRSLWSAASGMIAQQTNVDTIANNLANVNTTGYKTQVAEFKSLLYQTLQTATTSANGDSKPVSAQVGLGVRNSAITTLFDQGTFEASSNSTAFAIDGDGLFAVKGEDGQTYYTRNGNFVLSKGTTGLTLCTTDGLPVIDSTGKAIVFDSSIVSSKLTVTSDGEFCYPDASNNAKSLGITIGTFQFSNPSGLEKTEGSMYKVTDASGAAMNEATNKSLEKSSITQGFLEASNVQVADEMVNLIVAQRAYEMNSKAIQASDQMMSQANQLRA
jgi:flagellar basal-body rod protein FlgG